MLLKQLDQLNLIQVFDDILSSGADIKPHWEIKYRLINEYLIGEENKNHTIIGDTETDILTGKKLGLTTVGVLTGIRGETLKLSKPDFLFKCTVDIKDYFQQEL